MVLGTHYRGNRPRRQPINIAALALLSGSPPLGKHAEHQTQRRTGDTEHPRQAGGGIQQRGGAQQNQQSAQPNHRRSRLLLPAQLPRHGAHKAAYQQRDGDGHDAVGTTDRGNRSKAGNGHSPYKDAHTMILFHRYVLHDSKMSI